MCIARQDVAIDLEGPQSGAPLREFLRSEPLLQGGKGARVRLDLETNTLFFVRLAEHVDVLANVGELIRKKISDHAK